MVGVDDSKDFGDGFAKVMTGLVALESRLGCIEKHWKRI